MKVTRKDSRRVIVPEYPDDKVASLPRHRPRAVLFRGMFLEQGMMREQHEVLLAASLRRAEIVCHELYYAVPLVRDVDRVKRHRAVDDDEVTVTVVERVVIRPETVPVQSE